MPHQRLRLLPRPDLHRVSALLALSLCFECVCAAHARPELTLTHTAPNPTTNQPTPPPPPPEKNLVIITHAHLRAAAKTKPTPWASACRARARPLFFGWDGLLTHTSPAPWLLLLLYLCVLCVRAAAGCKSSQLGWANVPVGRRSLHAASFCDSVITLTGKQ